MLARVDEGGPFSAFAGDAQRLQAVSCNRNGKKELLFLTPFLPHLPLYSRTLQMRPGARPRKSSYTSDVNFNPVTPDVLWDDVDVRHLEALSIVLFDVHELWCKHKREERFMQ